MAEVFAEAGLRDETDRRPTARAPNGRGGWSPARVSAPDVTEAEARAVLLAFVAVGEIERWIAEQRWEAVAAVGGREPLNGWRFRLEPVADGVRVIMSGRGGEPAAWIVVP